jgi:hypothetical protein
MAIGASLIGAGLATARRKPPLRCRDGRIQVRSANAVGPARLLAVAWPAGLQSAQLDPAPDSARDYLQRVGNLHDGQELVGAGFIGGGCRRFMRSHPPEDLVAQISKLIAHDVANEVSQYHLDAEVPISPLLSHTPETPRSSAT